MDAVALLLGEGLTVAFSRALVRQMAQKGHRTAEFVASVAAADLTSVMVLDDLVFAVFYDVGVLVEIEVDIVKEALLYLELRKHMPAVYGIVLHLVQDLHGVGKRLRMVREKRGHLLLALEVFLLRVTQSLRVVY